MCGVVGFWEGAGDDPRALRRRVRVQVETLRHRGPDSSGTWCDPTHGLALGHRRLSILDLSPQGHQPMVGGGGRYVLSYNGEIYNHLELREELGQSDVSFCGRSDTETLLACIARWGLDATLPRLVGMFAFALWDRKEASLTLVRDRMGIKPLYWGLSRGTVLFGSELKTISAHPAFAGRIDRNALVLYLRHGYVPDPACIFEGFHKLAPGGVARFTRVGDPVLATWWSATEAALEARAQPLAADPSEAADELERRLRDAVGQRMVADVPVGAFLSGGIDSSAVVALMQSASRRPVRTFSIGFDRPEFDESRHAARVATHLGTDHTELIVQPEDAQAVVPSLSQHWDEPFADSSAIPTLLLSRLARSRVTVALSGDGGDELFGGYRRYAHAHRLARICRAPRGLRGVAALCLDALSRTGLRSGKRARNLARYLRTRSDQLLYRHLVSHWKEPADLVRQGAESLTPFHDRKLPRHVPSFRERMMLLDTVGYLPGDILTKVDRASMSVGLEVRVPLLDHRVFELAWRLPLSVRMGPQGKGPLRSLLDRIFPVGWFDRPKQGFGVPLGAWLRGPLRPWAEELLDPRLLREEGLFDPEPIRRRWQNHVAGEDGEAYALWDVLVFRAWHRHTRTASPASAPAMEGSVS